MLFVFPGLTLAQNLSDNCSKYGWVEDKDPKGTNIRSLPGTKGKVVGLVPLAKQEGGQVMVEIVGYSDGWLKIKSGETVDGTVIFEGTGWISAKKVVVNSENAAGKTAPLYAAPKVTSKRVGSVPNDKLLTITGVDCFGVKVVYKGIAGWLRNDDVCGNPVTTCP